MSSQKRTSSFALALVLVLAASAFAAVGCGDLSIPDGKLKCSPKGECPSGFECRADKSADKKCWLKGHSDGGTAGGGGHGGSGTDGGSAGKDASIDVSPDSGAAGAEGTAGDGGTPEVSAGPCPALDNPMSGLVSMPSVIAGSIATYSCNLGYTLTGAADRTCQGDSTWTGTAPTCTIKDCGALTAPTDGMVSAPVTTYGATATYTCGAGKGPSGSATRTCQLDGKWDGMQPTCVVANCPALAGPTGGSVVATTLTFGSTATYACDSGFVLTGMATRMCKTDGTWSDAAPTCTVKMCGILKAPTNGTVNATGMNYGATGTYACDSGYTLSGAATVMCQTDGAWSASAPTCAIKDCGALAMPTNGSVTAAVTTFGSTATYSCAAGYVVTGAATRMCAANGMWSGAAPTCVLKDCGALTPPTNGSVAAPVTTFGATATYSCTMGYGPSGSATRTCTAAGWDGTAPTCVIANCPALAGPTGGSVSAPTLTFGATATYACNAGYDLAGAATRTCQASGAWSGAAPTCAIKSCGALTMPANGSVAAPVTTYGATATYSCAAGYGLSGAATRTCGADGLWTGAAPTCAIKNCGTLAGPTNGAVDATVTTYGATATYSCNTGYGVTGTATRTCQADGTWSGTAPACALKDCGGLTNPANGSVSAPTTTYGATATYSCVMGYGPSGSTTRTCQATGAWSGTAPTCVIANCPALSNPAGGLVSAPTLTYGSMAMYSCNAGYNLNGLALRTCQANGQWNGVQPTCDPKDCGTPPKPTNGNVTYTMTTYTYSASYSCNSGYTLSGATTRSCQSDGTWSASVPSCVPVDCGAPAGISNGTASYTSTTFGVSATYNCSTNYTISGGGSGVVTCLATAKWSTPTPSCVDVCTTGVNGSTTHCCKDAGCGSTSSTPKCDTASHTCIKGPDGFSCNGNNAQCQNGHCVGGICCESACTGTCDGNTCAGGKCDHASKLGNSCQTRVINQPGYNDIQFRCDINGSCVGPTVWCGTKSNCDLTTNVCCMTTDPYVTSPLHMACTTNLSACQCGPSGPCHDGSQDQRWFGCKSNADCPNGMVCSAYLNWLGEYGLQYTGCFVPGTWPGGGNQFNSNVICDPMRPANPQCPTGNQCQANGEIGYCF